MKCETHDIELGETGENLRIDEQKWGSKAKTTEMDVNQHYLGLEPTTDEICCNSLWRTHKPLRGHNKLLSVRYLGSIERAAIAHCCLNRHDEIPVSVVDTTVPCTA